MIDYEQLVTSTLVAFKLQNFENLGLYGYTSPPWHRRVDFPVGMSAVKGCVRVISWLGLKRLFRGRYVKYLKEKFTDKYSLSINISDNGLLNGILFL